MANLLSIDYNSGLFVSPKSYRNKEELWFSVELAYVKQGKNEEPISGSFHLNDFVNLAKNIESLLKDSIDKYNYQPLEPYLNVEFAKLNNDFEVTVRLSSGPVFNDQTYDVRTFAVSNAELEKFINELHSDLKRIDPDLIFEKTDF